MDVSEPSVNRRRDGWRGKPTPTVPASLSSKGLFTWYDCDCDFYHIKWVVWVSIWGIVTTTLNPIQSICCSCHNTVWTALKGPFTGCDCNKTVSRVTIVTNTLCEHPHTEQWKLLLVLIAFEFAVVSYERGINATQSLSMSVLLRSTTLYSTFLRLFNMPHYSGHRDGQIVQFH